MKKEEIVDRLTNEHKKTLRQWAKDADREVKDLVSQFCDIYSMDVAEEEFGDSDDRIEWALRTLKARIAHESATPTEEFEIYVIGKKGPQTGERDDGSEYTVGSVLGVGVSESEDSLKRIEVTGWDDKAQKVSEVQRGQGYSINGSRQNKTKDKVEYNFEATSEIKKIDFEPDNVPKLLKNFFEEIEIAEARQRLSENRSDLKMIRATVEDVNITTAETGNKLARLSVYDGSMPLKDVGETGLFTVLMPAEMAEFGPDSEVCFVGTVNDHPEYGVGMFASGAAPILKVPYEPDMSSVDEDTLEVDDADEVVATEEEIEDESDFDSLI